MPRATKAPDQTTGGLPKVLVSRRGADRLRGGHVWVYRSDVEKAAGVAPGALVEVVDPRGKPLGSALYSSSSQIAVRLLSSAVLESQAALLGLLQERLNTALEYRYQVVHDSNAFRLVFSEADGLPGLIVDRYNDLLTLQVLTQAMDAPAVREVVLRTLESGLKPAAVIERVDARIRELEQLPSRETGLLAGTRTTTTFTMNGVQFRYDAQAGQKTGAFLDQRENYAAAARYAHGEALDVFTYQGGFALHLARKCKKMTAVDSSRPALESAEENEKLNAADHSCGEIEWIEANAFDLMKDYSAAGQQYDTIVLDPPAFAKSKASLETALRGYKELNLRALKMLRPGGVLVTCSCSHHVSSADFQEMLRSASADTHRSPRLVEVRGASQDHPVLLTVPETSYLKCCILKSQ